MSTRSRIAIRNPDGSLTSVYCHNHGEPEGVGLTLRNHYTDEAKIRALLDLGDLSRLGAELGERHRFEDDSHPAWCTAYGRDRGDRDTGARQSAGLEELAEAARVAWVDWLYIRAGFEWVCAPVGDDAGEPLAGLESVEYWIQRDAKG